MLLGLHQKRFELGVCPLLLDRDAVDHTDRAKQHRTAGRDLARELQCLCRVRERLPEIATSVFNLAAHCEHDHKRNERATLARAFDHIAEHCGGLVKLAAVRVHDASGDRSRRRHDVLVTLALIGCCAGERLEHLGEGTIVKHPLERQHDQLEVITLGLLAAPRGRARPGADDRAARAPLG